MNIFIGIGIFLIDIPVSLLIIDLFLDIIEIVGKGVGNDGVGRNVTDSTVNMLIGLNSCSR